MHEYRNPSASRDEHVTIGVDSRNLTHCNALNAPFASRIELIDGRLVGGARLLRALGLGRHARESLLQPLLRKLLRLAAEIGDLLLDGRDRVAQTLLERLGDGPERGGRGRRGRALLAAAVVVVVVLVVANLAMFDVQTTRRQSVKI